MSDNTVDWNERHLYKIREKRDPVFIEEEKLEPSSLRSEIEPWLTALFQSEHLSLLLGAGISSATHYLAKGKTVAGMEKIPFTVFQSQIEQTARQAAEQSGRGEPNIEDQIRVCNELISGLSIYTADTVDNSVEIKAKITQCKTELNDGLIKFANQVLEIEQNIVLGADNTEASEYLMSFLVSFASRSATRERLNIFTTNYDRIIEYGSELAGIRLIDRFVGTINPVFRSTRAKIDMHYNPPGIRGEPRYLEGVVHITKLHGSLDWCMQDGVVRRFSLPYGAKEIATYLNNSGENLLIYPNAAKDRETSEYPYVDLFRDLAASICQANSTLVVYGYSFGDDHINRVITDMLTIPSTHLVIISYSDEGGRIKRFYENAQKPAQISLLVGTHFGDLKTLVNNYLPKPAIDRTSIKMADLLKSRALPSNNENGEET